METQLNNNKSPATTKTKTSILSNSDVKCITNIKPTEDTVENPNFLRIPLNSPRVEHHRNEIINEKRSVELEQIYIYIKITVLSINLYIEYGTYPRFSCATILWSYVCVRGFRNERQKELYSYETSIEYCYNRVCAPRGKCLIHCLQDNLYFSFFYSMLLIPWICTVHGKLKIYKQHKHVASTLIVKAFISIHNNAEKETNNITNKTERFFIVFWVIFCVLLNIFFSFSLYSLLWNTIGNVNVYRRVYYWF